MEEKILKIVQNEAQKWKGRLRLRESADDISQAVFLKLWETGKWPPEEALAVTVVKHHALDLAKMPVWDELPLEDRDAILVEPAKDRQEWLDKALKGLGWTEQKAVRLRLQGLTLAEVSKEVDLPPHKVARLLNKTAKVLNRLWQDNM